jgi:hypothetical protein
MIIVFHSDFSSPIEKIVVDTWIVVIVVFLFLVRFCFVVVVVVFMLEMFGCPDKFLVH